MISFRHMAVAKSDLGFRLVVSCLFLLLTGCQSSQGHFNKHAAIFIFGDSLFDPGNNNYINTGPGFQANFWPYGESYFNPPSGRFSNGRLISDFIGDNISNANLFFSFNFFPIILDFVSVDS